MIESIDPFKEWDASYVLGALSPDELQRYEEHLAVCDACSTAVASFRHIPAILGRLDLQSAVAIDNRGLDNVVAESWDDSEFIQRLTKSAATERQKVRFRQKVGVVAASLASLTIGITAGIIIHSSGANSGNVSIPTGKSIQVTNFKPQFMTATLRLTSEPWGTRVDWSCAYGASASSRYGSTNYDLIVTDSAGRKTVLASWMATGSKATGLTAVSAIPVVQIRSLEITLSGSKVPLVVGTNI